MNQTLEFIRGICLIVSLTIFAGLVLVRWFQRTQDEPRVLALKIAVTVPVMVVAFLSVKWLGPLGPFVIVIFAVIFSILWTPNIGALVSKPFTSAFDGGNEPPDPKPFYSVARALRGRGKVSESVAEIQRQLGNFPGDMEGMLLLAEVQAENLKDLAGAETTVQNFCDLPGKTAQEISAALTTMADWHLKLARNHVAARNCLQRIIVRFPGSEFAVAAEQRIAHLGDAEMFRPPAARPKYAVPEGIKNSGLRSESGLIHAHDASPEELAAKFIKQLEQYPHDTEAREKLAVIYADHYHRLDLASGQLEEMLAEPNQPPRNIVRWLNLLADLQIRCGADYEAAKLTLQRVAERYPSSAAAEVARNRIELLRLEIKAKEKTQAVKLGSYEQDIGLKMGLPRQL